MKVGVPQHMKDHHTWGPGSWIKEASCLTLGIPRIFHGG